MSAPAARSSVSLRSIGPATVIITVVLLSVGAWFRLKQLPYHQNLWAIDWLGYYEQQARDLNNLNLAGYLLRWEGLHPPLSGVLHGGMAAAGLGLPIHWAATITATLAAPLILGLAGARRLGSGALVLSVLWVGLSPLQANYGLNTTPYPWLLLFVGGSTALFIRMLEGESGRTPLVAGLLAAAAIQIHVLAFAVVLAQAIVLVAAGPTMRPGRGRGRGANSWWITVSVSSAVLCWHALAMTRDSWTFHVSEASEGWFSEVTLALTNRFGDPTDKYLLVALVALGIVGGLLRGPRVLIALLLLEALGTLLALCLFFELNVADPRLVHYYAMPQMLFLVAGAWGISALAGSLESLRNRWLLIAMAVLLSGPWFLSTIERNQEREQRASAQIREAAGMQVRALFEGAGQGDVVAYLWDNQFLNDESDHLDPIAALWPTWRLGRPCFDIEMPPHHCNAHAGSHFFFSPSAQTGRDGDQAVPFDAMEEGFRRIINLAAPPGRAVIVVAPGKDAPERPWPMERWLTELGAVASGPLPGGLVTFSVPSGTRVSPPPPLHP